MLKSIEKEILKDVLNNPNDTFYENVLSDFLDEQGVEHDFRKSLHNNPVGELKPYQEKCLDVWRKHWVSVGLCTNPTDESKAEQYFSDFYKELGLKMPKKIIWFNNPVEMCSQVGNCMNNQVIDKIFTQIWDQVGCHQVWNKVGNKLINQVWGMVYDQLVDHIRWQVWTYISNKLRDQVRWRVWNQVFFGQQDAYRLVFYSYMMQVLRIKIDKSFAPLILLTQQINWWIPIEKTIYATRKPKECIVKNNKFVKIVFQDNHVIN
jgi:hypothetical protein